MKAKEMKEKAKIVIPIDLAKMEGKVYYKFTLTELQAFCGQLCQEQKEKCYDNFTGLEGANDILNAEMPEL